MTGYKYVMIITDREYGGDFEEFLKGRGVKNIIETLANGTAMPSVLDSFGLEKTEKIILGFIAEGGKAAEIRKGLYDEMNLAAAGGGIAVILPIDGIGGESSLKYFSEETDKGERIAMENTEYKCVMLTVIADKGNSDTVMEAARGAGATGGTVVRAKGTGAAIAKFFGITISADKEIIYIVAKREKRDDIMHAIMEKAGKASGAHGIVFSLPIDAVAGIAGMDAEA